MLKKIFIGMAFFLLAATQINLASAMSYGEMYLGGLTVGSTVSEMKRMYGEPSSDKWEIENIQSCYYGNSVEIGYNNYNKKLQSIDISANNGWKTPSGLAVGDNISKALDICGNPDDTKSGNFKTAYCYFHKSYSQSSNKEQIDFGFIILFNKDSGKILQLGLWGGSPMAGFEDIYQGNMQRLVE